MINCGRSFIIPLLYVEKIHKFSWQPSDWQISYTRQQFYELPIPKNKWKINNENNETLK